MKGRIVWPSRSIAITAVLAATAWVHAIPPGQAADRELEPAPETRTSASGDRRRPIDGIAPIGGRAAIAALRLTEIMQTAEDLGAARSFLTGLQRIADHPIYHIDEFIVGTLDLLRPYRFTS